MPDIFSHDTAVVWTRQYLKKHPSTKGGLDGMEVALHNTLAECAAFINETYDVEGIQKVACASLAWQQLLLELEYTWPGVFQLQVIIPQRALDPHGERHTSHCTIILLDCKNASHASASGGITAPF
jgi:hypothetical protein